MEDSSPPCLPSPNSPPSAKFYFFDSACSAKAQSFAEAFPLAEISTGTYIEPADRKATVDEL
jgi:hypothetical protein